MTLFLSSPPLRTYWALLVRSKVISWRNALDKWFSLRVFLKFFVKGKKKREDSFCLESRVCQALRQKNVAQRKKKSLQRLFLLFCCWSDQHNNNNNNNLKPGTKSRKRGSALKLLAFFVFDVDTKNSFYAPATSMLRDRFMRSVFPYSLLIVSFKCHRSVQLSLILTIHFFHSAQTL